MSDIRLWLASLDLVEYADTFAENGIDFRSLPELSEDDLKEIGLKLGHRRVLQRAIRELEHGSLPPILERSAPAMSIGGAERRQLTVMFCDLVGSTALSSTMDPEEFRELIAAYQSAANAAIEPYEGYIARYMGDGLLVYFGYPQAHEDDAERAVRAALDTVSAIEALQSSTAQALQVRIGIATGLVIAGDIVGEGASEEHAVLGDTPNLAARLQGIASPNAIVISQGTQRLVEGRFELEPLGPQNLKGIAAEAPAFRAVSVRGDVSRFEAAHHGDLTRLVGREHEVGILLERWQRAIDGEGQVVLLSGEAGIGKSRILDTMCERLTAVPHTQINCQCSPYHANSALYPIVGYLEQTAGIAAEDSDEHKLDKLKCMLADTSDDLEADVPLLAALLSLPLAGRYTPLELSPQLRKTRTLTAFVNRVSALARQQPLLFSFEDVHWIDPTTLELLALMIDRAAAERIVMVITHRPEFTAPWQRYAHVSALPLTRLSATQCEEIACYLSGGKALPEELLTQIPEKTDGVPLFVEELTKTLLESGLLTETADRYELTSPLPPFAIPSTLQDSLMARLDRLGGTRELAQIGAAIGREFSYRLLQAVALQDDQALEAGLRKLTEAELIFRRGHGAEASYFFKHALVQDAAYESLLKSKRQDLHTKIAATLKRDYRDLATGEPELLAHHYTRAGLIDDALPYYRAASRNALRGSAPSEALSHLTTGLKLLEACPQSPERDRTEIEFQALLGSTYVQSRGNASAEAGKAYTRAYELCRRAEYADRSFAVLWGVYLVKSIRGESREALRIAEEMLHFAGEEDEPNLVAHTALTAAYFWTGRYLDAQAHMQKSLARYDVERHEEQFLAYSFDMKLATLVYGSQLTWILGYPDHALTIKREMDDFCEGLNNPFMLGFIYGWGATVLDYAGDREAHLRQVRKAREISVAVGLPFFEAQADFWVGWNQVLGGDVEDGITLMADGLRRCQATGAGSFVGVAGAYIARALMSAERLDEAEQYIELGLERVATGGLCSHEAELHRAKGTLHSIKGALEAAEKSHRKAIRIAQAQQAKSWELRAASSLAVLFRNQGDKKAARQVLAPVYGWFTEGLDTPDLKEAKSLLDELA